MWFCLRVFGWECLGFYEYGGAFGGMLGMVGFCWGFCGYGFLGILGAEMGCFWGGFWGEFKIKKPIILESVSK